MTFNARSKYVYRTANTCTGFSIRRINWKEVVDNDEFRMITVHLKNAVKENYEETISSRIKKEKELIIQ